MKSDASLALLERPPQPPARRAFLFRILTICLVLGVAVFAVGVLEWILRTREDRIRRSNSLEPGLLRHDSLLGWSLAPGAVTRHRHHDFAVRYTIADHGFRADTLLPHERTGELHLLVGDSFTFGFGVNDNETFVHRLNKLAAGRAHFLNCAVPAYSTDQEALLIERDLLKLRPAGIWLIVYLGNDLLDNQYSYPIQAHLPKPYFEFDAGRIALRNTPVPVERNPSADASRDLMLAIMGPDYYQRSWRAALEKRSVLFQSLHQRVLPRQDYSRELQIRCGPTLKLFWAILERADRACAAREVKLRLILMPGKSFIEQPSSLAAQYQDFLRREIRRDPDGKASEVLDLADLLRTRYERSGGRWFHPHEGHLNVEGHRIVAEVLFTRFQNGLERVTAP